MRNQMSQSILKERIEFLRSKKIIEDDDFIDIDKLSKIDKALINTAYDLANKQLKILNFDDHGN